MREKRVLIGSGSDINFFQINKEETNFMKLLRDNRRSFKIGEIKTSILGSSRPRKDKKIRMLK